MYCENNASKIVRGLMTRVAELFLAGTLADQIDQIALEVIPRQGKAFRCCIHKDRAVIRNRLLAILGFRVEETREEMERGSLAEFARRALARPEPPPGVLTVIDEACSACVQVKYFITDVCRRCVARPCFENCPKKAIEIFKDRAHIDHETCVNCGICMKVCPFHAVVYVPIPCEEACPVGAIKKDPDGTEDIDFHTCVYCGKCVHECPFGAIMDVSHLVDILKLLGSGRKVVAMLAPAIVGQFPADLPRVVRAIKDLGFHDVVEVALGADLAAAHEAREFAARRSRGDPFMTTSCCPAYNQAVEKHLPGLKRYRSQANTPMHYTAELVRAADPDAVVVFVGPCVAKRREIRDDSIVDHYLSFEELSALLSARGIDVTKVEPLPLARSATRGGRGFPLTGGVAAAIKAQAGPDGGVEPFLVDGFSRANLKQLEQLASGGKCSGTLVEVMACEGGCVGGPSVICNPRITSRKVRDLAGSSG